MLKLRVIKNPLELKKQEISSLEYVSGKKLKDYLTGYKFEEYNVIVSGGVIKDFDKTLRDKNEIILIPKIKDPITAALAVIWTAITLHPFIAAFIAISIIYSLVQAFMFRPRIPSYGGGDLKDSNTYGWDGIQTMQQVNIPIPIVYGQHRVGGNRINVFIESEPQYDWKWKTITAGSVVNSGYVNTFTTPTIKGIEFSLKALLYRIVHSLNVGIAGIGYNLQGNYQDSYLKYYTYGRVRYKIEYKKTVDSEWTYYTTTSGGSFWGSIISQAFRGMVIQIPNLEPSQYDIRITAVIPENAILGVPENLTYYSSLKGKVPVESPTEVDRQYLNILLGLCEGEIEGISDILINDNPISNFSTDGISPEVHFRKGTNDDEIIDHFEDLHDIYELNVELKKDGPYTYTTLNDDVEGFILGLSCPNGLMKGNADGSTSSYSVQYKVEYKINGEGEESWVDLGTFTVTKKTRSAVRFNFTKEGLEQNKYDIRVTKLSIDSTQFISASLYLIRIDEIKKDDLIYPNLAKAAIRFLAYEQLSGQMPNTTLMLKGLKVSQPKIMCEGVELDYDDYYYDNGFKRISDGAEAIWYEEAWVTKWSANPIWCMYDLLTNKRYGLGWYIDAENLPIDLFIEMANYCDELTESGIEEGIKEKRFQMDVVLDSQQKATDWIMRLCSTFRAMGFYTEGLIKIIINKPEISSQVFGKGNIIENSFSESFASLQDVKNSFEVEFTDASKDYKMQTYGFEDKDAIAAGEPPRTQKYSKIGVTRLSQIVRDTRYEMRCMKYLTRTISFKAMIDAITCQVFDVIEFAYDVPQWSIGSGRVKSGSNEDPPSVVLDEPVVLAAENTYRIRVRHNSTDIIEEKTIKNEPGTYTELIVDGEWDTPPQDFDVYAVGVENLVNKLFRIVNMKRLTGGEVEIVAIEYNEDIFDEDLFTLPLDNYSMLSYEMPYVSNLVLVEKMVVLKDGTIENCIEISFQKPEIVNCSIKKYAKAKIYISDNSGESWICRGETADSYYLIQGDITGDTTYTVAVVSVSDKGEESTISLSPQASIEVIGKSAPPANVTGFDVHQEGNILRFSCDPPTDFDFAFYRIKKGQNWSDAQIICERADLNEFIYPIGTIGTLTFLIKALDTSGNESDAPTSDIIAVEPPPEMNFVNEYYIWSLPTDYKLTEKLYYEYRNLFNPNFVRKALAIKTAKTWEELELEGKTWEEAEAAGDLILDKEFITAQQTFETVRPLDLGLVFEFKIVADPDITGGMLIIELKSSEDGITYTDWEELNAGKLYRAKYLWFRFKMQADDANHNSIFYNCTIYIEAPVARITWVKDILIPAEGKEIYFGNNFLYAPRVIATISNGIVGMPVVSEKTKDGCLVKVYNPAGNPIGVAEVDLEARGY
jgi:predicted phage tail protein